MRNHTYICCNLLILGFCFSLVSGVEARPREKQQMLKQNANPMVNISIKSIPSLKQDKKGSQPPQKKREAVKTGNFNAILMDAGDQKINVIKVVREITGLSLKLAKDLVESAPKPIKVGISREEAELIRKRLTEVRAKVDITEGAHK